MTIVGGFDVHRRQITFDCLDVGTGQLQRGQISPAHRGVLREWLVCRFAEADDVQIAVEGCTGWRFVVEELTRAGIGAHLADPAETASLRGRKRRAKTDRADARLQRELLVQGRLPECFIPPGHILELRALLSLYHDLHQARHGWLERIHATLFHHGVPKPASLTGPSGRARLAELAAQVSPSGQQMITTGVAVLDTMDAQMRPLYRQIAGISRQLTGSRLLQARLHGVGPLTAAALLAWLGGPHRFSSSRKAVRFCGLDITVYSSDTHRSPGHLSRQGPPVLRWLLYEAGMCGARAGSPDHHFFTEVADRASTTTAALSQARRLVKTACHTLTELGADAFTPHQPTRRWTTAA